MPMGIIASHSAAPNGNHLLLAEQLGVGTADLSRVEVLGSSIAQARYSYTL